MREKLAKKSANDEPKKSPVKRQVVEIDISDDEVDASDDNDRDSEDSDVDWKRKPKRPRTEQSQGQAQPDTGIDLQMTRSVLALL